MKKVSFTEMKKGTKEDYLFLDEHEQSTRDKQPKELLNLCLD